MATWSRPPSVSRRKCHTPRHWHRWLPLLTTLLLIAFPTYAFAGSGQIAGVLCTVALAFTGATGKAIASVGVVATGLLALWGRITWTSAFAVAAGIATLFGAASILNALGIGASCATPPAVTFACNGPAPAPGSNLFNYDSFLTSQGASATSPDGIFARLLYMFQSTVGGVLSYLYCSFSDAMLGPLHAILTVFVSIFGVLVLTGIMELNIKQAAIFLFKFALVWMFVSSTDWVIGVGYNFFISFAEEASNIVLSTIPHSGGALPSLTDPDAVIGGILHNSTGQQSTLSNVPLSCTLFLGFIAIALIFFMPILLIFIVLIILGYLGTYARALLNYLTALVLISFLFILAPFFLSFALFRTTVKLFDTWIQHLIAFSLQMVIMFGFMALLASVPFADFFTSLLALLKGYSHTFDFGVGPATFSYPLNFCGICDYTITNNTITCNYHPLSLPPHPTQDQIAQAILTATQNAAQHGFMLSDDHNYWVISLWNLFEHSDFVQYVIAQSLALYLLTKVIGDFMKKSPELASAIGKLPIAAALGGGKTPEGGKISFVGLDSIQAAYQNFKGSLRQSHKPRINFARHPLKYLGSRLNPAKAAHDWKARVGEAVIGRKVPQLDRFGQEQEGQYKREGGLLQGFWQGRRSTNVQQGINTLRKRLPIYRRAVQVTASHQAQAEQSLRQVQLTGNRKAIAQATQALRKASADHRRAQTMLRTTTQHLAMLEKSTGEGALKKALDPATLFMPENDPTRQKIEKMRDRLAYRQHYGKEPPPDKPGRRFMYWWTVPEKIAEATPHSMNTLRAEANSLAESLETTLHNSGLSEEKKAALGKALNAAKIDAQVASSADQLESTIKHLNNLARKIT